MIALSKSQKDLIRYLLLVAVLVGYFAYLSYHYGLAQGGMAAGLTWSFFVLCTPIADAGFLLDFPVRLITGLRMMFSEMMVWVIAGALNFAALEFWPGSYDNTALTRLLKHILLTPWPYWSIIVLCAIGTFVSVILGDHAFDVAKNHAHHNGTKVGMSRTQKIKITAMAALFLAVFVVYYDLISTLGIEKIIEGG